MNNQLARLALLLCSFSALALPPGSDIGVEWNPGGGVYVMAIGDFNSQPGYEFVASDGLGVVHVYSAADSNPLGTMPVPFNSGNFEILVRDLDGDGYGELICLAPGALDGIIYGVVDVPAAPALLWSVTSLSPYEAAFDVMNLSSQEPRALVVHIGWYFLLYSPVSGQLLYDSSQDGDIASSWRIDTILIDDFENDGYEEILAEAYYQPQPSIRNTFLIGDRAAGATATDAWGARISLEQSWPNPAAGSSTIAYSLAQAGRVQLRIYDAAGRLVRTLVDSSRTAGSYREIWDGKDDGSARVASGIYYYELDVNGRRETRKLVQVR